MSKEKFSLTKSKVSETKNSVSKSNSTYVAKSTSVQHKLFKVKPRNTSFRQPMNLIDTFLVNQKVEYVRKHENIRKYKTSQNFVNDRKLNNVRKSSNSQPPSHEAFKSITKFTPQKPNFPNPSITKPSKVSSTKGKSEVHSMNHWLEGQGKRFQS